MAPRLSAPGLLAGLSFFLPLFLLPPSARSQETEVSLDAGVSHALPPPGIDGPSATYLRGGLRLGISGDMGSLFAVAAGGASLADQVGSWGWAALGGERAGRFSPRLGWRVSLTGSGFSVGAPTRYEALVARLRPELVVGLGEGTVVGSLELGAGRSEVETADGPVESDLWVAGGELELRRPLRSALLRVGAGGRDGAAGAYATAWLGLEGRLGPAQARAEIRGWRTPVDDFEATGSLRISLDLGPSLVGWAAGGRSGPDPLLGTPAGDFLGSGISWRVVAADPAGDLPVRVVDREEGRVAFRVEREDAGRVVVVGDFSGWAEVPLERRDGQWVLELALEPGLYHYGFVVDGEWWVPEDAVGRTEDEWGRPTAVFHVPDQGSSGPRSGPPVTSGAAESSNERRVAPCDPRLHCMERIR